MNTFTALLKKYLAKKIFLRFSQNTTVYQEGGEGDLRGGVRNVKENIYTFLSVPTTHL